MEQDGVGDDVHVIPKLNKMQSGDCEGPHIWFIYIFMIKIKNKN